MAVSQQQRCCSLQPSPTWIQQQILSFKRYLGDRESVCGSVMQTPGGIFSQFLKDFETFPKAQLDSSRSLSGAVRSQTRSEAPPSSRLGFRNDPTFCMNRQISRLCGIAANLCDNRAALWIVWVFTLQPNEWHIQVLLSVLMEERAKFSVVG